MFYEVQRQHCHQPGHFRACHASVGWQALWWWGFPLVRSTWHLPTEPKLLVTGLVTMVLLGLTDLTSTPKIICVEIVKRKMRDTRTNHTDEFKTAIKAILGFRNTSAEPQAGHLNTTPHWWSNLFKSILDQVLSVYIYIPFRILTFLCDKSFLFEWSHVIF